MDVVIHLLLEFEILSETASLNYSVEKSHMDVSLPPSLAVQDARYVYVGRSEATLLLF